MENKIQYVIPLNNQKPKTVSLCPNDLGSRYKCRQLQIQVIGKSKMIKTVLVNILDVAKDMQVPPAYVGVYMGYDIGAQAKFDAKKPERQQAFLSGEHSSQDLSRIMQQFIQEFVLCSVCGLPEILITSEKNSVVQTCRACGHHGDMNIQNEKFKRHVINHPPSAKGFGGNKTGAKKEAKVRKDKVEKDDDKPSRKQQPDSESEDEDDVEWFSDTSKEAALRRRLEMLPDTVLTAEQPAKPTASSSSSPTTPKKANGVAPSAAAAEEPATPAKSFDIAEVLREAAPGAEYESLRQLKAEHHVSDRDFVKQLFDALCPPDAKPKEELTKKKALLAKFLADNEAAQHALLDSIETFYSVTSPSQLAQVTPVVKELYDLDLLDEEHIISWFDDAKRAAHAGVRKQLQPLVDWLKAPDDDDDDDEEDDEEDEDDE